MEYYGGKKKQMSFGIDYTAVFDMLFCTEKRGTRSGGCVCFGCIRRSVFIAFLEKTKMVGFLVLLFFTFVLGIGQGASFFKQGSVYSNTFYGRRCFFAVSFL